MTLTFNKALDQIRGRPWVAAAVGLSPLAIYIYRSYCDFHRLGPSGLPQSFLGYLFQASARPWADLNSTNPAPFRDPKALTDYAAPYDSFRFFAEDSLPARRGDRPTVPSYTVPQRQTSEVADVALITRMNAWLLALKDKNPGLLAYRNSNLEHHDSPSLWLKVGSVPLPSWLAEKTRGEIVHVHNEGSSHMVLSVADADLATRKGWAQRHALSGRLGILPLTYVLIYAPRDEAEFEQWKAFVKATVSFTAAGSGIEADYDI